MVREKCKIVENKKIAPGHYILKLASSKIVRNAKPGQFVQILCADSAEPLLPRPFSFLTVSKQDFSILYQVVGQGTKILSQTSKGDFLWILGPLGNGFMAEKPFTPSLPAGRQAPPVFLVGGGVGIPPLYHLAQTLVKNKFKPGNVHIFLGARNKALLLCESDFKKLGVKIQVATDDGSKGKKGFVTQILEDFLIHSPFTIHHSPPRMFTCGPTPMLKAVSSLAIKYKLPCEVSVEVPMACGFGACLGCAVKVNERLTYGSGLASPPTADPPLAESQAREFILRSGDPAATKDLKKYRFAIACTEGPVFQAGDILWD